MANRICPACQLRCDAPVCPSDGVPTVALEPPLRSSEPDPLLGRVFEGRYRIDERLGRGGMGTVYRAQQMVVNRPVALKVLHGHSASEEREVARFRQEARAVATLCHPHTVTLIDYGETDDGVFFLVMELIVGHTLRELIAKEAPVGVPRATHILAQIAESLAEAHASGIVHRDLKPANVLLTEVVGQVDFVKVVDFGIAKVTGPAASPMRLTGTGLAIGSPRFMSPEQVSAKPVSAQSDLYALGAVFYELVTGRPLFPYTEPTPYLIAQLSEEPRWPEVDGSRLHGEAVEVFMACLAKLPSDRPADAMEVLRRLQGAAAVELLERMSPVAERREARRELETTTVSLDAAHGGDPEAGRGPGLRTGRGPGLRRTTTRRERAPFAAESLLLPGQHVAVSSSPTVSDQGAVAPSEAQRPELANLLETKVRLGVRHHLQTGFPVGNTSEDEASFMPDSRPVRSGTLRAIQVMGVLAFISASVLFLGDRREASRVESPPMPHHLDRSEASAGAQVPQPAELFATQPVEQEAPPVAGALVQSEPEGARVRVDGIVVGRTPLRLSLPLLMETLSLELEGYHGTPIDVRELHQIGAVIVRMRARH
jgi:serine/threonine protein kinase